MTDFTAARLTMVENQLRPYEVTQPLLLAAFSKVRREDFVAPEQINCAYLDRDVTARDGKSVLMQPMVLGRMIQSLELRPHEKVLCVGGGGYSAALLSALGMDVIALEVDADAARASLTTSGFGSIPVVTGELSAGVASAGLFDAILVNGAAETEPKALLSQLKEDGALAIIMGRGRAGRATVFKKVGDMFSRSRAFDAAGPLLAGFAKPAEFAF